MKLSLNTLGRTCVLILLSSGFLLAGVDSSDKSASAPQIPASPNNILSGILNLDFSNYHLTPRGVDLQNQGLVTQQLLLINWKLYTAADPRADINEVTFTTGYFNDIDSTKGGVKPNNWNESDPIVGVNVNFLRDWSFTSEVWDYIAESNMWSTCWNWDPTISYHDHFLPYGISINPSLQVFYEISNKSTVVFDKATSRTGYYFVPNIDPTYKFKTIPLTVELPTSIMLPSKYMYQRTDGTPGGTDFGIFSVMLKGTVPLEFLPSCLGKWNFYAGVQYNYLSNPGLLDGNQNIDIDSGRNRNHDIVQYHTGLTLQF